MGGGEQLVGVLFGGFGEVSAESCTLCLEGNVLSVRVDQRGVLKDVFKGALDMAFLTMFNSVLALLPSA